MGLLSKGTPLEWCDSRVYHRYVKAHGIRQFINIFRSQRERNDDQFLWGDEVEHLLLHLDSETRRVRLSLRAAELIDALEGSADPPREARSDKSANFLPEYGRFMIEATPSRPYGGFTSDLRMVEHNMRLRRSQIEALLTPAERLITLTGFPLMGVGDFAHCHEAVGAQAKAQAAATMGPVADSDYIPDTIIGAHPRFATLTRNIRTRRGARVDIRVPLFQDENTERDVTIENAREQAAIDELLRSRDPSLPPHPPRPADLDPLKSIHMDAMAFGMGMACLQVTFQTRSIGEARRLYDHLAVFSPIMLALTAASPFFRGRLADIDARWTVISQSVDDRTPVEKGEQVNPDGSAAVEINLKHTAPSTPPAVSNSYTSVPSTSSSTDSASTSATPTPASAPCRSTSNGVSSASSASSSSSSCSSPGLVTDLDASPTRPQRLYKSRYDSISTYLSLEDDFDPKYNDIPCEVDPASYQTLLANDVDELLSRHVAHLFVRDPLVIYSEHIELDDEASSDHFENLQSTNWQTVRFKPPAPGSSIGWRVEFRTMEVQLTDFENAAFTVFIALVSRALLYFNLNFYIPLSKVDENLKRAHERDAVLDQKFFWRKNIKLCATPPHANAKVAPPPAGTQQNGTAHAPCGGDTAADAEDPDAYEEMSIRDILLGSPDVLSSSSSSPSSPSSSVQKQPGLLNLVRTYLDMIECDVTTRQVVDAYLDLISSRCTGELMSGAAWLRKFVEVHPAYKFNSLLNNEIVFDMVEAVNQIVKGTLAVPQLLGAHSNLPRHNSPTDESPDAQAAGAKAAPPVELKGARRPVAPAASVASSGGPRVKKLLASPHSFDLTEQYCCEKLKRFLTPYLERASSLSSTPGKSGLGSRASSTNNVAGLSSPGGTQQIIAQNLWLSPPPDIH